MPYYNPYRGDYKTYGYGRGDPGFLSSLWKGIKKVAAPVLGFALGGPVGAVIGGLGGGGATPPIMAPVAKPMPRSTSSIRVGPMSVGGTDFYPPVPQFRGGGMPAASAHERMAATSAGTGCCPRGYHLAKDGSGRCVRNRRMNVANPRAMRRAMRRAQGFEKMAKRVINFNKRVRPARKSS